MLSRSRLSRVAAAILPAALAVSGAAVAQTAPDGWRQTVPGVYEHLRADGGIDQLAVGTAGANYTRQRLEAAIAELDAQYGRDESEATLKLANDYRRLLARIPAIADMKIQPTTASTGQFCDSRYIYVTDSFFTVGLAGATAEARTLVRGATSVTLPPPALSLDVESIATITHGASVQVNSGSGGYGDIVSAITNWNAYPITSASCSASTDSQVTFTVPTTCSGTAFINQHTSYPTCQ